MKRDFYKILGVNQKAGPEKIRKAYRQAAKLYHPDVSPRNEEKFKEVQEAYETLSDPKKRSVYDQQVLENPTSKTRHYPPHYSPPKYSPFNLFHDIDELFAGFERSWRNDIYDFFSEREETQSDFSVEIILSREEARAGCELLLKIPLWVICRRCQGTGSVRDLICGLCRGRGEQKVEKKIKVTIPSGVKNGMKMRIPLKDPDLSRTQIIVTLMISP
jgi:DnaJ-class molecular chaperone